MESRLITNHPADAPTLALPVRIIPPEEHPITLDQIDRDALFILKKLNEAGFASYLVGGGVRDLFLGKTPKDFDISTDARPGQLRKLFPHSNTIGRRFRLVQVFFKGGKTIEVSTLRSLCEHDLDGPEEILAPNNTFGTVSEDARRRDLTINSLFFEIINKTIIDYVGGTEDLDNGIIRIFGDPSRRICRDPVRMMRAIRHAARNGFQIESETWKAICSQAGKLALCPSSRLRDEVFKDFYGGYSAAWARLSIDSGIFFYLFPFYRRLLQKDSASTVQLEDLLYRIFSTIDRVNDLYLSHSIPRHPDYFVLGLILIPWVEGRWQLFSEFRKTAALFQLAKQIRDEVDQTIGIDLNLRRSLRQEMVNLLVNLSLLIHNKQEDGWPKWLKKKSYFRKTRLFYHYYIEAVTGKHHDEDLLIVEPARHLQEDRKKSLPQKERDEKTSSAKCKPAFSAKTKGGIFGFKK